MNYASKIIMIQNIGLYRWNTLYMYCKRDREKLKLVGNKFGFELENTMIQKIIRNPNVSCINMKGRQLKEVDT